MEVTAVEEEISEIEAVEEIAANSTAANGEVSDEFCTNEEYTEKPPDETPSTTFRFIVRDSLLSKGQEAFENKLKQEFKKAKLNIPNQSFIISQYEQSTNESKFYMKVKTNPNVFDALRNMKTDEIFYTKLPPQKTQLQ